MQWKPIESAPKDMDADIILWTGSSCAIGYWDGNSWCSFDDNLAPNPGGQLRDQPTHWMPLPDPPTDEFITLPGKEME